MPTRLRLVVPLTGTTGGRGVPQLPELRNLPGLRNP